MTVSTGWRSGTVAAAVLAALLVVSSAAFVLDVGATSPEPAPFEDTVVVAGTTAVGVKAGAQGVAMPKAQIFFSQYRYVVGTYGVAPAVSLLQREGSSEQFGRPLVVYVSDFAGTGVERTDDGSLVTPDGDHGWVPAPEAHFVVAPDAGPEGASVVPFSDRAAATAFADAHGGEVRDWSTLRAGEFSTVETARERMTAAAAERRAWADRTVADARRLLDRPVSVVVGEDAPTLQAAVEAAPPNTTVEVPAGTYDLDDVTIRKPLTLRGAGNGTHLAGDGNGSVIDVRADRVGVVGLSISGVGTNRTRTDIPVSESAWDYHVKLGYGYAPAGVELNRSDGSLVRSVAVETPSHGIVARHANGTVVERATVRGTEEPMDGFMGVMAMQSRLVVQRSTFLDGRDAVYTHRAHDVVVRNNRMAGMRFGVHEMYTNGALVANNTVRRTDTGVIVMTRPRGSYILDNDVRDSARGISLSGFGHHVAGNVLAFDGVGISVAAQQSLVERNVVAYSDVGLRASALVPSNWVLANDVVGNDQAATATLGPLRIWGGNGAGNYWANAPGEDRDGDGTIDRAHAPTGTVESLAGRRTGAETLARSPAVSLLRAVADVAPGLRATGVMDYAPRVRPVRPETVRRLRADAAARGEVDA
ncbi:MAG: NosD domain-containing protein [Halobacteriales archaeon]